MSVRRWRVNPALAPPSPTTTVRRCRVSVAACAEWEGCVAVVDCVREDGGGAVPFWEAEAAVESYVDDCPYPHTHPLRPGVPCVLEMDIDVARYPELCVAPLAGMTFGPSLRVALVPRHRAPGVEFRRAAAGALVVEVGRRERRVPATITTAPAALPRGVAERCTPPADAVSLIAPVAPLVDGAALSSARPPPAETPPSALVADEHRPWAPWTPLEQPLLCCPAAVADAMWGAAEEGLARAGIASAEELEEWMRRAGGYGYAPLVRSRSDEGEGGA